MNSILQKIKVLQNQKNLTTPKLAENIGLSRQGMYDILKGKIAVSIKHLELLSNYFQVPMTYWFEDEKGLKNQLNEPAGKYKTSYEIEIKYLKKDIERLESQVRALESHNETLKEQLRVKQNS